MVSTIQRLNVSNNINKSTIKIYIFLYNGNLFVWTRR